ncbi:MAG: Ref family protein [Gammaproteobacteria bacterium]|nr:Ref family protein [Gammaproteobacteria bacterium]
MDAILEMGCVICKKEMGVFSPTEIHHIDGKTKPDCHLKTIPLCYRHHRAGEDNEIYTSRHPTKRRFEDRYGSEQDLLDWTRNKIGWDQ